MKGNEKVNMKCTLDADKGNDDTSRYHPVFPLSEVKKLVLV